MFPKKRNITDSPITLNNPKGMVMDKKNEAQKKLPRDKVMVYTNENIKAIIYKNNSDLNNLKYQLTFKGHIDKIEGVANLITLEDEFGKFYIPEGSAVFDEKNNEEYFCDSTYSYESNENFKLSISFEKVNMNRISLVIYKSKIKELKNGFFTLYKSEKKN